MRRCRSAILTCRRPSPYGFINYFLNTDRKQWPSAPGTAFMHNGNGLNMVYVDPENDLVAVVRWIDNNAVDGFLKRLIAGGGGEELGHLGLIAKQTRKSHVRRRTEI
jgi:CubicO group peptidase (beta-lactamase class C family)